MNAQIQDTMIAGAKALAAFGLAVFPVAEDCRRPLTPHGYKDATKAPGEIEAIWRGRPRANIAVACGSTSGVFVLDVDTHEDGPNGLQTLAGLEADHGPLPQTWRTLTPSGGLHIWFRQPDRRLRNRVGFAPGLDVRTDGGSVAVPPSRKSSGVYAWVAQPWAIPLADAPQWLLSLIDPPMDFRPRSAPVSIGSTGRLAAYAAVAINGECSGLACMKPNSGRNSRLFQAAARLGELVAAGIAPVEIVARALEAAAGDCGLVAEDGVRAVAATIHSGLARGMLQPREVGS